MKRKSTRIRIPDEELWERLTRLERNVYERFEKLEGNELVHLASRIDSLQTNFSKMLLDYQERMFARIVGVQTDLSRRIEKIFYCAIGILASVIIAVIAVILKVWGVV